MLFPKTFIPSLINFNHFLYHRHYSAYLYCGGKNADKFHLTVQKNLECHTTCEKSHSPRYCAYTSPECVSIHSVSKPFQYNNTFSITKVHNVNYPEFMCKVLIDLHTNFFLTEAVQGNVLHFSTRLD